jgi:hypothetical protein
MVCLATATVTLALPLAARAQQVFPTGVDLVAVDVTVVDRQGRPVADLRAEDFEVKVGGQVRRIVSAQLVRQAAPVPEATTPPAPLSYCSNQDTPRGRLIVLVPDVGWMSTGGGRALTEAAGRFLAKLAPQDRVALITIPVGPSIDFTTDHAGARAVLEIRGAAAAPSVQYEVAAAGEPGPRLMTAAGVRPTGEPGCFNAEATLDLGPLPAGRYELRAVVLLPDGGEAGRVSRTLGLLPPP